jgi:class 3 adenylate cyclase
MDVGGWLRKLGLEQYEAAFRENRIDDTVLPSLTAEDLKDLGVGFVGDRRKLLDAIAAVRADASARTLLSDDAPTATEKAAQDTAERRQVTVMFSDLVGSTALSARMDPEDLREVISAYQKCVAETVRRCGGFVAKYMGDGVLVYFGYPQAHEDDAEQAVRAGLDLVAAMTSLKTHTALQTRVGIATGLVVVGDLIGSGASQEQAIVGKTPNLAARLQGVAEPNSVVIAEGTRRLLGNLFEFEDLGAKNLKGIAGPVRAWAALRASSAEGRFEALHTMGLTAQQRRQRTLEVLTTQVVRLASRQPVLMIFEDAHWTDPTSLEAFGRIVDGIKTLPVLFIVTFRLEFNAPWVGQSHVTSLTLNRLGERDAAAIIARVAGNNALQADVMAEIVERTDGIPLFVEEMTKAVLEAESEGVARRTIAAAPSPALLVPASLHASLMARLDRLGSAKEVAQIGAAIGRQLSHALLAAVVGKPEAELGSALDRIVAAGLLFRQGVPPQATYLFKHALVQDAAYGTLLREPRRALHARVAETLESQFVETAENQPEILAHHCTEAGLIEKAAGLWGKAGQRSLSGSALVEATVQLHRALELIATLPGTMALRAEQIKLQVALANALMHIKGYSAPETKASFEQARLYIEQAEALGEPLEDPLLLFSILYGSWVANIAAFNGDICCELAGQFLALAEKGRSNHSADGWTSHHG